MYVCVCSGKHQQFPPIPEYNMATTQETMHSAEDGVNNKGDPLSTVIDVHSNSTTMGNYCKGQMASQWRARITYMVTHAWQLPLFLITAAIDCVERMNGPNPLKEYGHFK